MSNKKAFGFLKGYSFLFEDDGCKIEAWFSTFSGLEKVFVNGDLVASKRSFSKKTENIFMIGENKYSTTMTTVSLMRGPSICTLYKNGKEYKRKKLVFPANENRKTRSFILMILFFVTLGVGYGIAESYYELPGYLFFIFLAALYLFLKTYVYLKNKTHNLEPKIIDEEII